MKNIGEAVQGERAYLEEKVKGTQPNIYDYIGLGGYTDLSEYRKDKKEFLLKNSGLDMERIYITKESLAEWAVRACNGDAFFCSSDSEDPSLGVVAIVGKSFTDFEKFESKGIYTVVFDYMRGVNITGIYDFNFCICVPRFYGLTDNDILERLKKFISTKYDNVEVSENDILVDGKKVVAMAGISNDKMSSFIVHISLTDYTELINELCPPHGDKVPGYMDKISKAEFENEVQSWLK